MKLTVNKGILMECVPEETGAPETEITLPEEVSEIREGVFRKAGKLRRRRLIVRYSSRMALRTICRSSRRYSALLIPPCENLDMI